jgi:hypothetical protein
MLKNYWNRYDYLIAQRTINNKTPLLAPNKWQQKKSDLFVKRVYD